MFMFANWYPPNSYALLRADTAEISQISQQNTNALWHCNFATDTHMGMSTFTMYSALTYL